MKGRAERAATGAAFRPPPTPEPPRPPFARFDDLRAGRATIFAGSELGRTVLVAHRLDQVVPVLEAVESVTGAGQWAAGFVSYEAAPALDPNLSVRQAAPDEPCGEVPLAWFGIFDRPETVEPLRPGTFPVDDYSITPWRPGWDADQYRADVDAVRGRIADGDTYQCNLTVRLHATVGGEPFGLYRDLALAQGGSHNAYLDTGRFVIASASPELFFDWTGDRLTTRPMKGTGARGRWPAEDAIRAGRLAGSPKDRAENVMIVDLLRNDLGRLAEWGSVEVPALFELERFPTLWQLTSTVTARPRPESTLVDVFRALFPCGSVTGAPKGSTMEIIAGLERSRRGVYCGAVGVVAPPGEGFRARFNVAIRTAVIDRLTGDAVFGTGGGITWDSTASGEHAELMAKTAILRPAAGEFALVETMGFRPGEGIGNLEAHLGRLAASASYFGFACDPETIRTALTEALAEVEAPHRVRLELDRSGGTSVQLGTFPPPDPAPVRLEIDGDPVDSTDITLFHKTTLRSTYAARAARHPGADDVVLTNERGELTESTIANLAVRIDGRWWTPPLDAGCLPGIGRARLIDEGRLRERTLTPELLRAADGIALVSSLRGWRSAVLATGRPHEPVPPAAPPPATGPDGDSRR